MSESDFKMDPDYLRGKLAELGEQVGGKPLLPIFVEQTRKVLAKDAKAYLRYGPYWWAMKRILRAGGVSVGAYDEPVWADEYAVKEGDAVSPELTLIAGWDFADDNIGNVGVLTNEYELGDRTFVLYDPDQASR
ncbi:MAG: hypothetical protein WKG03_00935 [Telluria sp.]